MTCSAKEIALNAAMSRAAYGWRPVDEAMVVEVVVIVSGEAGWLGARSHYERSRAEGSLARCDPEPALQPFAPRPAHAQPHAALHLQLVVATAATMQRLHQFEPHDHRPMHAHEAVGIEPILERLHGLADHEAAIAHVQLSIRTRSTDVIDLRNRNRLHLPVCLHRDALQILRARCTGPRHRRPRTGLALAQHRE